MDKYKERIYQGFIISLCGVIIYFVALRLNKANTTSLSSVPQAYDADKEEYDWEVTDYATDLEVPWDMAFDPEGRLFITERPGNLKLRDTNGVVKTIATLDVAATGESGLTGMALHPHFSDNGYIYLYYTYRSSGQIYNRVSRFTFQDNQINDEKYILNDLPGGSIHNGGRLRFGPDRKLWVPTGDAGTPSNAQDFNSLGGKVLRVNDDGSIPSDNPYPNSFIYSYGQRNPQGLAWHPLTEELLDTEHGESAHDEINLILPKQNYGWAKVKNCYSWNKRYTPPILCSDNETWAPSGIAALGTKLWRFRYSFVFTGLRGNVLKRIAVVDGKVTEQEDILKDTYGRLRAVVVDSEATIYVSTSNKDGRGEPKSGDDKILKLVPKKK